jgi:hypothetical protein
MNDTGERSQSLAIICRGVHKSEGGTGADYPEHSKRVLDLKQGKNTAVEYFRERVEPKLMDEIVTVPSHDPASPSGGLRKLAAVLAKEGNRVDGSDCLAQLAQLRGIFVISQEAA